MQHYFLNQKLAIGAEVQLPDTVSHHLSRVLRAEAGDEVELVSSEEQVFIALIEQIESQRVIVKVKRSVSRHVELPINVTIVSGLSKKNKPEWIVQKSTELGAAQIIFMPMARSIVKWDQKSQKKVARLNEVAQSAAEQSHRNIVPRVQYLSGLSELTKLNFDGQLVAYEEAAKQGETSRLVRSIRMLRAGQKLVAVFGPEGGISDEEMAALSAAGYVSAGLGPRILRTETAPLYLLSAISVLKELV